MIRKSQGLGGDIIPAFIDEYLGENFSRYFNRLRITASPIFEKLELNNTTATESCTTI